MGNAFPVRFLSSFATVVVLACLGWVGAARAQSPAEAEITALMARWSDTYATGTPADMLALYTADAVFWGTGRREPMADQAEIEAYFASQFNNFSARLPVELHDPIVRIYGDGEFATNTGTYTFRVTTLQGQPVEQTHRYSFAYARFDGEWRIAHQHSSAIPP